MNPLLWTLVVVLLVAVAGFVALNLAWRWASRKKSLPCPSMLAWLLDAPWIQRLNGTQTTVDRLRLQPGERVLELGPGPGRLLVPVARRILPDGEAVGIDIQAAMLRRLENRVQREGLTNVTLIEGDAAQPHVAPDTFDVAFLCTVLGEIPDRAAAMAQCFRALKPGGRLAITEMAGDPHYQSRTTVRRLAEQAGFRFDSVEGHWWFFTAHFTKPS